MKRKLLPLLIAGMTVGATGAANADSMPIPTVYGKVNVTLNKYEFDDIQSGTRVDGQDNWQLESNASRLGVKGDVPLVGNLKAIYKLEYEAYVDGSNSTAFGQRNTYAGLQGSWGTIFAGKNDTPLKAIASETVQKFKDLPLGDFKYIMVGENREKNIIEYATPNLSGLIISVALMPGEDNGTADSATGSKSKNQNNGIADRYSVAATYQMDKLYLALAGDHNVENTDTYRFVAEYGFGPVTIDGMYQNAKRHDKDVPTSSTATGTDNGKLGPLSSLPSASGSISNGVGNPISDFGGGAYDKQDAYAVSAAWALDKNWILKAQYAHSTSTPVADALGDTTAKNWLVGVDYKFSSASKVFAYYGSIDTDGDLSATTSDKLKDKTYALGYELKF